MSNKLSFTKVKTYLECGKKYDLHYNQKLRAQLNNSALFFGKALDEALNELLLNKDLQVSKNVFLVNYTYVAATTTFNDNDFDKDILENINYPNLDEMTAFHVIKTKQGFDKLTLVEQVRYNNACYASLKEKGIIILESYNKWVIPKIKTVIAIQDKISVKSEDEDEFEGIIDLIAEFKNGKTYLLDNKTSSWPYEKTSAKESFQLNAYHHFVKDKYQLDGLGFIVMNKNLWKQKTKICSKCSYNGSDASFRTCNQMINKVRCKGEWNIKLDASCFIDIILNEHSSVTEELVLETINKANNNIKNENFAPNLTHCKQGKLVCQYFNFCHNGDKTGLNQK